MAEGTLGIIKVKEEAKNEFFCYGCLSSDRRLTVLSENTDLFVYLLGNTCVSERTHVPLCWECSAILRNTRRFQQRIRRAQDLLQQTLYQEQTLQTLIARDTIKSHSSIHKKIFDPDHYDLCIEHTDTLTDINMADTKIKIEIEELDHEESLYEEVQLKQEFQDPLSPSTSTRNDMVFHSNTDTIQSNNNNLQNKLNIASTVHGAAVKQELFISVENVQVKYENVYHSDIDIDEVDIEAAIDEKAGCSAEDKNIEHQLNKHEENLNEKGIDSDDCERNVSERSFKKREKESSLDETLRQKSKLRDENDTKTKKKIEVINAKQVVEKRLKKCTESKTYKCNICKKIFLCHSKLKRHLNTHTGGVKRFSCEICDRRYNRNFDLKRHIRVHTGEKLYSCEFCGKTFNLHSKLKLHSRIHTGEQPYSCELCDKKFTYSCNLKIHSRIHTGDKPYSCETCGKNFSMHSSLKFHAKIHTGEKKYSCQVCDKNFTTCSSLKRHSRIHTGEKIHNCDVCCKRFTQSCNLKRHLKTHNSEKPHSSRHAQL